MASYYTLQNEAQIKVDLRVFVGWPCKVPLTLNLNLEILSSAHPG